MRQNVTDVYRAYGKRSLDLVIVTPTLIALSPLIALVGLAVRIKLGSPVFYYQERPGMHGQLFVLHKFRTMRNAVDVDGQPLPDEQRLTNFGRFLRSTSLDELPELLDVLRGDMSLIGPRPLFAKYLERYSPDQKRRLAVKPGVTGWAQINGRNLLTWNQKFALDLWYVDHLSLALDLKILVLSVHKTLTREGISQPGHATAEEFMGNLD